MNVVFDRMKSLIPFKTCRKERMNENFTIIGSQNGEIVYLNETSGEFYGLCDGRRNISQIIDEMLTIYDADRTELEEDIISLIRDLQWNDIIGLREERS